MSAHIEWMDADAIPVDWEVEPGAVQDAFSSVNDGPCLTLGSVVIEGPVAELRDLVVRMEQAISEIEEALEGET